MTAAAMDGEPTAGTAAAGTDLAKPPVNEPREPEQFLMQAPQGNPLLLSHTLQELLSKDSVQVELIPEKKGLFLKHVEYEVSSKRFKCSVYRRYNDFVVFHEMLLQKFPYRMVPALPPKRMLGGKSGSVFLLEGSQCKRDQDDTIENKFKRSKVFASARLNTSAAITHNLEMWLIAMLEIRYSITRWPLFLFQEDEQNVFSLTSKQSGGLYCTSLCRASKVLSDILHEKADREFIESRRRALKRFINLVARHPPFSEDVLLKLFLSFSGSDVQNKLRELVQGVGDEFMTCRLATQAKDFLPADIQAQFAASRELIRNIYNSFYKLRDRAERIASRAIDNASDLLIFGKELSALGSDTTPLPSWAALNNSTWGTLKQALKGLSVEFALLADKAVQQGKQEENDVVEKLNLFLDLLQSYKDLCERHEKGVLHKHQRALHKYSMMKKQMMSATVQNKEPESVEQLESRIVEQENAILTMELRNYFSLYCLHQETQLIHIYLPLTSHILGAFVNSQIQGHKEMSKVWNELKPKLSCLFVGSSNMPTPPLSPPEGNFFSN